MSESSQTVLIIIILVILFLIAMWLLKWLINVLLPVAIIVILGFIAYRVWIYLKNER